MTRVLESKFICGCFEKIKGFETSLAIPTPKANTGDSTDKIDDGLSPRPPKMDPAAEIRETKRQKEYYNTLGYVADGHYGIPVRCPCGGRIIDEVRGKEDYDTLPGKSFFTCINYQGDGLHYRQPWVHGVQEEIEKMIKCVEEAGQVVKGVSSMKLQIEFLEDQVRNLTERITDLERLCVE